MGFPLFRYSDLATVQSQCMNPRELRIGNFIRAAGAIVQVVAIDSEEEDDIEIREESKKVVKVKLSELAIEPIYIDRDLLISYCGFDRRGRLVIDIDLYFYFLQENEGHIVMMSKNSEPIIHFWDVKTVHQLQNLYHAFKGRELSTSFHQP